VCSLRASIRVYYLIQLVEADLILLSARHRSAYPVDLSSSTLKITFSCYLKENQNIILHRRVSGVELIRYFKKKKTSINML
jgi:hypothetical protein